jgi:hypothetical protein
MAGRALRCQARPRGIPFFDPLRHNTERLRNNSRAPLYHSITSPWAVEQS